MNGWDEPTLTKCDLCGMQTAAVPGPRNRRGRPEPPAGYRLGFIVEQAERAFPCCFDCLQRVLKLTA